MGEKDARKELMIRLGCDEVVVEHNMISLPEILLLMLKRIEKLEESKN